jgi:hypothetical protein
LLNSRQEVRCCSATYCFEVAQEKCPLLSFVDGF